MTPYIERRGLLRWYIVCPGGPDDDDGMGTEAGPYLTRIGARLSLRMFHGLPS